MWLSDEVGAVGMKTYTREDAVSACLRACFPLLHRHYYHDKNRQQQHPQQQERWRQKHMDVTDAILDAPSTNQIAEGSLSIADPGSKEE